MTASSARSGSVSVTITCAPIPFARSATPRPTQPYPEMTKRFPASSTFVARMIPSIVDCRLDVRVVRVVVLALDREHGDVVLVDEGRGDVVLRRKRIGRAQDDVRAGRLQRARQVRGLRRHVQARGDAVAGERLLALEALA